MNGHLIYFQVVVTRKGDRRDACHCVRQRAGSSMTANARQAPAIHIQGCTSRRTFITQPSLETNATSIAKRMKKV